MVRVRWKLERGKVYLILPGEPKPRYYWFPKVGHKRFRLYQIFTRSIHYKAYTNQLIPFYAGEDGWKDEELGDEVVREKLGIHYE